MGGNPLVIITLFAASLIAFRGKAHELFIILFYPYAGALLDLADSSQGRDASADQELFLLGKIVAGFGRVSCAPLPCWELVRKEVSSRNEFV